MTVMFAPYLNFDGNRREAFEFYHSVLGVELFVMSNDDMPSDDRLGPEWNGRTVYAALTIGDAVLMASDVPPGTPFGGMQAMYVNHRVDSTAEAERIFAALADGGQVQVPLTETFFAARFGSLVDRFGTPWMTTASKRTRRIDLQRTVAITQ